MSKTKNPVGVKKSAKAKRARALFKHAPSKRWKDDISNGLKPYPSELMPLSKRKTFDADPTTPHNYNPIGERGVERHTPPQCVSEEDMIDGLTPDEAFEEAKSWPSSIGSCFDARGL